MRIEKRRKNAENSTERKENEKKGKQEGAVDEGRHGADVVGASHFSLVCGVRVSADVRYDYCL